MGFNLRDCLSRVIRRRAPRPSQTAYCWIIEPLDARRLFAAGREIPLAHVEAVFVSSTAWTADFKKELQAIGLGDATLGYALGNGLTYQPAPLPWTRLNRISVRFDQEITDLSRLEMTGVSGGVYEAANVQYSSETHTLSWNVVTSFNTPDRITVLLKANSKVDGRPIDGDRDGQPDGVAAFQYNITIGDTNRDRQVDAVDLVQTRNRIGRTARSPGSGAAAYDVFADINGDGVISAPDVVLVRNNASRVLPGIQLAQVIDMQASDTSRVYAFDAVAGQVLYIDSLAVDRGATNLEIFSPRGETIARTSVAQDSDPFIAPVTGSYRLSVQVNTPGKSKFRVLDFVAAAVPLQFEERIARAIPEDGHETLIYRFDVLAGERYFIEFSSSDAHGLLYNSDGRRVGGIDTFRPLTFPQDGTFFFVAQGSPQFAAPSFTLRVLNLENAPVAPLNQVIPNSTDSDYPVRFYRLPGTAGQNLVIEALDYTGTGSRFLLSPSGAVASSPTASPHVFAHLTETGDYLLVSDTRGAGPFRIKDPEDYSRDIGVGEVVTQAPDAETSLQVYHFTATAGQRLYLDSLAPGLESVDIFSPTGQKILTHYDFYAEDPDPFTTPIAGKYYLLAFATTPSPGSNYSFRLLDVAAQPTLEPGAEKSGVLAPATSANIFRIQGVEGQRLFFDSLLDPDAAATPTFWKLYGASRWPLSGTSGRDDFSLTLPTTGEYLLVIAGYDYNMTAEYRFRMQIIV